jgi:hypothetical protein
MGLLGAFGMCFSFHFFSLLGRDFLSHTTFGLRGFACEVDDGNLKDLMASRVVIPTQYWL